ncbi:MAG: chemotaxis protein CheW [Spirochaetes bacterium]|nr:chemotaxis protein CheW [Spirochaetota bacterium]
MALAAETTAFLEDLEENLSAIESALQSLEEEPTNSELLRQIFRAAHTIKGNAAMMNLTPLVALGHAVETALQEAVNGNLQLTNEALRLFVDSRSAMASIGQRLRDGKDTSTVDIRPITDHIQVLLLEDNAAPARGGPREVEIRVRIARAELVPAVRAFLVETKIAELGEIVHKDPSDEKLESPEFLASERIVTYRVQTVSSAEAIRDNLNIDLIDEIILAERGASAASKTASATIAERGKAEIASDVQATTGDTVRLAVRILDRLLNLTGELVLANSSLDQIAIDAAQQSGDHLVARLTEKNREIYRIAAEIQNIVMQARMLPLATVFSRFRRFVRDYAEANKKSIRLEVSGEDTELDKRVIDEIVKPLTHLIRNSLDHGLEPPAERIAAGKAAEGFLRIAAAQAGSSILIVVEDDGRGLNKEKILARAIEKGLISTAAAEQASVEAIHEFIFMPGFSTRETADDISGRGFGMDIVRDSIKKLAGDISLISTEGKGTRMTIKLPLTLAILTTLTFKVRNDLFAIPLNTIDESLRVPANAIMQLNGREVLHNRDTIIPFIRLDRVLGYPDLADDARDIQNAIVVDLSGRKFALGMDEFLKKQELVVKSLGENYRQVKGLAGASMVGDNEIVFILDIAEVAELSNPTASAYTQTSYEQKTEVTKIISSREAEILCEENKEPEKKGMELKSFLDAANSAMVREWIAQSNKAAVKGIRMLTGNAEIAVKRSRGARIKSEKSRDVIAKLRNRAADIFFIHLPMIPAAGAIDLIMNRESGEKMAKLLFSAAGIEHDGEFDASPLLEITNILGSAYTNTLTFLTEKAVEPATPTLLESVAEINALIDKRLADPQSEMLVVENQFHIKNENIEVELVIYLAG